MRRNPLSLAYLAIYPLIIYPIHSFMNYQTLYIHEYLCPLVVEFYSYTFFFFGNLRFHLVYFFDLALIGASLFCIYSFF